MNPITLRILDANLNRAREALRVIEDWARFGLNDSALCEELKNLRHALTSASREFLGDAILFRDTDHDVGTQIETASEFQRETAGDVVAASCKRLGEALRTIEEYFKTINSDAARKVESLRYRFYTVEQKIARTLRPAVCGFANVRLYVLITEAQCKLPWLEATKQAIEGGADCLQLREKNLESGELLIRARQFVKLCREHNVISIINDRPDIALLCDAHGVHVGQSDLPAIEVRKIVGAEKIVGVSTHNLEQARQAARDGADYIGVGPIFPSQTKPRDFLPGTDFAKQIARANLPIPAVAIAGITRENIDEVLETGIGAIAVTSAALSCHDVRAAVEELKNHLNLESLAAPFAGRENQRRR